MYLSNLSHRRLTRFKRLGDLSDLDNSITNLETAVDLTDDGNPLKAGLGGSQHARFQRLGISDDFSACVLSFKLAAQSKAPYPSVALRAARKWAQTSRSNGNLSSGWVSHCFETSTKGCMAGPSREAQLLRQQPENLGCLAANCAIQLGRFEEAVELLDLGHSVLWQQASSSRTDLVKLRDEEPELAGRVERLSRKLDAGNFSSSISTDDTDNVGDHQRMTEDNVREYRQLVCEWEGLVEKVRPQFKYFLKPVPFHQLRQICTKGQVVVINASPHGVDALMFENSGSIDRVSLPGINLNNLTELFSNVVLKRPAPSNKHTLLTS